MPLMPDSKVAKDRYHVCLKTLSRWDEKPELKFPAPKVINNRKYRDINELDAWDVARALTETAKPTPRGVAAYDRLLVDAITAGLHAAGAALNNSALLAADLRQHSFGIFGAALFLATLYRARGTSDV